MVSLFSVNGLVSRFIDISLPGKNFDCAVEIEGCAAIVKSDEDFLGSFSMTLCRISSFSQGFGAIEKFCSAPVLAPTFSAMARATGAILLAKIIWLQRQRQLGAGAGAGAVFSASDWKILL